MKTRILAFAPFAIAALLVPPASAQTPPAPQIPTVRTTVDEVLLDLIVRDKKGKPVTDLKPQDLTVSDNNTKQTITSFRLVSGADAIAAGGAKTPLDPLRQVVEPRVHGGKHGRQRLQTAHPRDLVDEIHLAGHVAAPERQRGSK